MRTIMRDRIFTKINFNFEEAEIEEIEHGANKAVIHLVKWKDTLEGFEQTLDLYKNNADLTLGQGQNDSD